MTDQPALQRAAERKSAETLERARTALAELEQAGGQITFQGVARAASVSRQWLYGQPQLRARIEALRQRPPTPVPGGQRSSEQSLRQRLAAALEDNQRLRAENQRLHAELAITYGAQRAHATTSHAGSTAR